MAQIKVRIERGQDQSGIGNGSATKTSTDSAKSFALMSTFTHQAISTGKQIVNYATNNIANFTGNYMQQDAVTSIIDIAGDVATIGTAFAVNPIAGAVAVLGVATKKTFEAISDYRNNQLSQRQTDYLLARSGNATKNGSRGTEN